MSADQPMSGAQLQTIREYLGFTQDRLAALLEVSPRTVRAWEGGTYPIPDGVWLELDDLRGETEQAVDTLVAALRADRSMAVTVWRTDKQMAADWPQFGRFGARWWRHVAARAVDEVPGARIVPA